MSNFVRHVSPYQSQDGTSYLAFRMLLSFQNEGNTIQMLPVIPGIKCFLQAIGNQPLSKFY